MASFRNRLVQSERTDIPLGGELLLALHRNINTVGVPESETIRASYSPDTEYPIS